MLLKDIINVVIFVVVLYIIKRIISKFEIQTSIQENEQGGGLAALTTTQNSLLSTDANGNLGVYTPTTDGFTTNQLTVTGDSGISSTTGTFSQNLKGTTGEFSNLLTTNGLKSTTGEFTGLLDAKAGIRTNNGYFSSSVSARQNGIGEVRLNPGDASHTGFISFLSKDDKRKALMGNATDTGEMEMRTEGDCPGFAITGDGKNGNLRVQGSITTASLNTGNLTVQGGILGSLYSYRYVTPTDIGSEPVEVTSAMLGNVANGIYIYTINRGDGNCPTWHVLGSVTAVNGMFSNLTTFSKSSTLQVIFVIASGTNTGGIKFAFTNGFPDKFILTLLKLG